MRVSRGRWRCWESTACCRRVTPPAERQRQQSAFHLTHLNDQVRIVGVTTCIQHRRAALAAHVPVIFMAGVGCLLKVDISLLNVITVW